MSGSNKSKDEGFLRVIHGMIQRFIDGAPSSSITFDLFRVEEVSMEKVYCVLMTDEDYQTISLMLQVLQHPKCVREQIFDAIVGELDKMKDE